MNRTTESRNDDLGRGEKCLKELNKKNEKKPTGK